MHIFLGHPVITSNTNIAVKVNINTFQSPGFPECFKLSGKGGAVEGQDLGIVLIYPRSDFSSLQISNHKKLKTVIKILYICLIYFYKKNWMLLSEIQAMPETK